MMASQLAFMASRIFALTWLIYIFYYLKPFTSALWTSESFPLWLSSAHLLVSCTMAAIFWFCASFIAKRLIPNSSSEDKIVELSVLDAQVIAFVVVGFLFVINAVPGVSQLALVTIQKFITADVSYQFIPRGFITPSTIEAMIYLSAGFTLIFGAKFFSRWMYKGAGRE